MLDILITAWSQGTMFAKIMTIAWLVLPLVFLALAHVFER